MDIRVKSQEAVLAGFKISFVFLKDENLQQKLGTRDFIFLRLDTKRRNPKIKYTR